MGGDAAIQGVFERTINSGNFLLMFDMRRLEDPMNDACLEFHMWRAKGQPLVDAQGRIESGQTFDRDLESPTTHIYDAAVEDGVYVAGPLSLNFPLVIDAFQLRLAEGAMRQLTGDLDGAEAALRALIADFPQRDQPVRLLYGLLASSDRQAEAEAVLAAALEAQPDNGILLWIRAGNLERAGDIDGAIAVYEGMYAVNSGNLIVANNLASLLATHRTDEASLERAWAVARRLRGQERPAFQDTYGWIASRRGEYDEALPYLEAAAEGLPEDPLVHYHLGMTYLALDRAEEARAALTRALEIAGDSDLPQFDRAREALAGLTDGGTDP